MVVSLTGACGGKDMWVTPNQVTILSIFLAIFAGRAFWGGYLVIGLLLGWVMTFLDTVDGKLARVTVSSSKIGDILDHGLDLVHPPLCYLAFQEKKCNSELSTWLNTIDQVNDRDRLEVRIFTRLSKLSREAS
jgi:phosphatidylglycerophosphate synthase